MFFFPRSGRLELLRTAHAGEFDRPKTGNYDSDRQVTDCGRLDTKPAFLIGGRLIGASLVSVSIIIRFIIGLSAMTFITLYTHNQMRA